MDIKEYSSNSLAYLGDAVYTLRVREFFLEHKYQSAKDLVKLCNRYNSAKGQTKTFERLYNENFFNEEEMNVYKRGRNCITHIPKNGDRKTYQCATGLEAIVGYLYLKDTERLEELFVHIFEGGIDNE
ncbi:MAG: ribonuclease III domain-containing protein [Erysipelotrichaceae bacterium]|nr:ribonuclease III domain-containing protein [Erysipelotrichaceae bacterium]